MKKTYAKPLLEVAEFRFSEHIAAASGGSTDTCTRHRTYDSLGHLIGDCTTWVGLD
jgi:hypothetical protein